MAKDRGQTAPATPERGPGSTAPARRVEDAGITLFGGNPGQAGVAADLTSLRLTPEQLANAAFLIELPGGDALVVPAADAHVLERGEGGAELKARAASLTEALRRERDWTRRRLQMPDHLLAFADRLNRADTEADIYEALRQMAVPIIGAYTGIVWVGVLEGTAVRFHPLADNSLRNALQPLPGDTAVRAAEHRLVRDTDVASEPEAPLAPLAHVLEATSATQLLCATVGAEAVLMLGERRRQRVFTGEDRDLLSALVRQAEAALRRVHSQRQAAAFALADPVSGLPAGRHVEVLVDRALNLARRGHALTALLVDVEETTEGSPHDRETAFYWLASAFSELRGTDLAIRQGDNRFLVLLGDTDAEGAHRVIARILEYVGRKVRFRAGMATFAPGLDTAELLARAAADDLTPTPSPTP